MDSAQRAQRVHELVEIRLLQNQLRYTKGRRAIIEVLLDHDGPVGIGDIERGAPGVPRSSAYRHLTDLQSVHAVRAVATGGDFSLFELSEDLTEHHHHLLCLLCGAVTDVTPTHDFEALITQSVQTLAGDAGFEVLSHSLDVMGHCRNCSQQ